MKTRYLSVLMAGAFAACVFSGCRKAPEAASDGDILRAKSSVESAVEDIAAADTGVVERGGTYDALVGTEENGIWICAEVPAVPQTVPALTLRERDDLDADVLRAFLDSENGNVEDITAEYLAQMEKELGGLDEEETVEWLYFGDKSLLMFSDGSKEASFARNTNAGYEDKWLKADCGAIYKKAPEIDITKDGEGASAKFSFARAQEILLVKLETLDIKEIHIFKAFYYEMDGHAFYELRFTPSYGNVWSASEFGQIQKGEVHPTGTAWVAEDGVASLSLVDFCGKITDKSENGKILTFSQVTGILEKYLESGTLCGVSQAKLTRAELVYYPVFKMPELVMTPVWHIYIPLEEKAEAEGGVWDTVFEKGAATNIYLDAVTGELIKAE